MALILVVDDRPGNREFLVTLLGYRGHRLLEAVDGAEALALVRAERPALVITDVLMPTMDGFEFVRRLRADPEVALTPVIFYTAEYQRPEALALAQAGGVHQLIKPAEPEEILRVVEQTLGMEPAADSPPTDPEFERDHLRLLTDTLARRVDLLESSNRRQSVVVALGQRALAGAEPSTLMGDAVTLVTQVLDVGYADVLELLPKDVALRLRAGVGWEEGGVGRITVGAEAGSQAGFTLLCREAVIVDDLRAEARFVGSPRLLEQGVTSCLVVVIPGRDRPFGILGAHSARRRDFTREEADFLQAVANVLAAAIERRQAEENLRGSEIRTQERYTELDRLYTTAPIGLGLVDRDLRFVRLNERLAAISGGSVAGHIGHTLQDMIPGFAEEFATMYGQILDSGEPVLDREFHCITPPAPGVKRDWLMSFHPLMAGDGVVREISVAVLDVTERNRVQEQVLDLNTQLRRRLEQIAALRRIDIAITASLDLRVILEIVLDETVAILGVAAAAILSLEPNTTSLFYSAGRGFRGRNIRDSQVRVGEGYAGLAALERRRVIVLDLAEVGKAFVRTDLLADEGFVAYYAVPLLAKGQVKGVLEVFSRTPVALDQDQLDFLDALAGQAAIAVDSASLFESIQRANLELMLAYDATIEGWSAALDLRDKETKGHSRRVTAMTIRLARGMGVGGAELVHARRGALLHDIGKLGIPDAILHKTSPLTENEWVIIKKHPDYAHEWLYPIRFLRPALDIPQWHHEKWDGTGYPHGLRGDAIPLVARIFAAVDVWDALRSDRPYHQAWPDNRVCEHIRSLAGTHLDPAVVDVFLRLLTSAPAELGPPDR